MILVMPCPDHGQQCGHLYARLAVNHWTNTGMNHSDWLYDHRECPIREVSHLVLGDLHTKWYRMAGLNA